MFNIVVKYALVSTILFTAFPSYALDLTPESARILTDPTYLPLTGQIWGYTDYAHTWAHGDAQNYAGDGTSSFHVDTDSIVQYLGFGLTDDFMINANIRWAPDSSRQIDYVRGGSTTLESSGFSDPAFGATYRLIDQNASPVSLDFFGSYRPDWLDADSASTTQEGTIAGGGQSGTVGAAIGQETRDFTIRGAFAANIFGDSNSFDLANGDTIHVSPYTNYEASIATQTRLTDLFSINAGISYTFASDQTVTNTSRDIVHESAPGNTASVDLALNYQVVPNTMILAATYDYSNVSYAHTTFADAVDDTGVRNRNSNALGARLTYAVP
jgi:outer membrane lipoprotein SlyB